MFNSTKVVCQDKDIVAICMDCTVLSRTPGKTCLRMFLWQDQNSALQQNVESLRKQLQDIQDDTRHQVESKLKEAEEALEAAREDEQT